MQASKSRYIGISVMVIFLLLIFPITIAFNYARDTATTKEINYNEFLRLLDDKQISKVEVTSEELVITPIKDNETYKGKILNTPNINDENLESILQDAGVEYEGKNLKETSFHNLMITWIIPIGIICSIIIIPIVIIYFLWRFLSLKKANERLRIQVKDLLDKK